MRTKTITNVLVALTVVAALGACSGGGHGSNDDGSADGGGDDDVASLAEGDADEQAPSDQADAEAELLDWVDCMRDEGVDLSDPTRDADGNLVISGPGINIGGGGTGGTFDEAEPGADEPPIDPADMDAATDTCGPPPAAGGELSDEDRQAQEDAALQFAECMRGEGIEDFPDPDFSDQGPQTNSNTADEGQEGPVVAGPFGEIDMDDPEVAAAFEACQSLIGPPVGEDGAPGAPADGAPADGGAA
jgi:hypothetical protein